MCGIKENGGRSRTEGNKWVFLGCGGLQRSERTSFAVPGCTSRNCLKHQPLPEQSWTTTSPSETPHQPAQRPQNRSAPACQPLSIPGNIDALQRPLAPFPTGPGEFSGSSRLIFAAAVNHRRHCNHRHHHASAFQFGRRPLTAPLRTLRTGLPDRQHPRPRTQQLPREPAFCLTEWTDPKKSICTPLYVHWSRLMLVWAPSVSPYVCKLALACQIAIPLGSEKAAASAHGTLAKTDTQLVYYAKRVQYFNGP
jgi:hypothetical protein